MEAIREHIRITKGKVSIHVVVVAGKDGEHFVNYSPSLNISSYGDSPEDAKKAFEECMAIFAEDLLDLSVKERDSLIKSMGWSKEVRRNKNFSKCYVDEAGILRGLEITDPQIIQKDFAA